MKISVLGAGNVGSHLARALSGVGHSVAVWNRSEAALALLRREVGIKCCTDLKELPKDTEIYLIAVKDDAVAAVAQRLADALGKTNAIVAHTAGSLPKSVLDGCFEYTGVFYPMQTFSRDKVLEYSNISFFVEEQDDMLHRLAQTISPKVFSLTTEQRKVLHLASVFACNFTNHCYAIAADLLNGINVPFATLQPLINETAAKVNDLSPREAQTGPAQREDYGIMKSQSRMLDDKPNWQKIYNCMSDSIIKHKHDNDRL
ncbi:MAG: DUF2520 domain-containing protein [Prevotellaceae bacterium]|nr:DUF2520 domain-containing protein [Prevotellaceae bacterium]